MINKVVCIDKPRIWNITPGKIYETHIDTSSIRVNLNLNIMKNSSYYKDTGDNPRFVQFYIIDDLGNKFTFINGIELYLKYFITLEEFREQKLNELLEK